MAGTIEAEAMQLRVHGPGGLPTLIYLPGLHGDWTLIGDLRRNVAGKVRFVEVTYPRTNVWTLDDYAEALEQALAKNGISSGWLLAESYGSQLAWTLAARKNLTVEAVVLAGGFVKFPVPGGVWLARRTFQRIPLRWLLRLLVMYGKMARRRYRHSPETLHSLNEFLERRTEPDKQAAIHRLDQIAGFDPRSIVQQMRQPVYCLSARFDPAVPYFVVRRWLAKHCPGYSGTKGIWSLDHNILATAHVACAKAILTWMGR